MSKCCTLEESIATLEHSHLATVVVEGSDDMTWYRWIEGAVHPDVSILPVGGRNAVLSIFKVRKRFKIPIAFVADKDLWVFSYVPNEYVDDLILTQGFSIENDILCGSVVEKLFTSDEKRVFDQCVSELTDWYAAEISLYLRGQEYEIDRIPCSLLDLSTFTLKRSVREKCSVTQVDHALHEDILHNFKTMFRGKNLLNLYAYLLQHRLNKGDPTYRRDSLIEMAIRISCSKAAKAIVMKIQETLRRTGWGSAAFPCLPDAVV